MDKETQKKLTTWLDVPPSEQGLTSGAVDGLKALAPDRLSELSEECQPEMNRKDYRLSTLPLLLWEIEGATNARVR